MPGRAYEDEFGAQIAGKDRPKVLVLENDFLRVVFAPERGGRLVELRDKRSNVVVLKELAVSVLGDRPIEEDKLVRAAVGDDYILLGDSAAGQGLGWQLRAALGEGATLELDLTVRNRTLLLSLWNPGLNWGEELLSAVLPLGMGVVTDSAGVAILSEGCPGVSSRTRFGADRPLAPRWGETVRITIIPFSGAGLPVAASVSAVVTLSEGSIRIEATQPLRKAKLVLLSEGGQTMEATADLDPNSPLEYTFAELGGEPNGLIILDAERNEKLRYEAGFEPSAKPPCREWAWDGDATPAQYSALAVEPATRYWASLLLTRDSFLAGDFVAAAYHAETALLYNGEDPLTWIEKAIALRRLALDEEDSPDLPNVHFLAPLEPLARAESFLRGGDSPLMLEALSEHPDELIEAACHYMSLGLTDDAARFLSGAIEVCDRPMLRYLYADCVLRAREMRTEAASAVEAARRIGEVGPWPWRPVERQALRRLGEAFPADIQIPAYFARSNRSETGEAC